jgi:sterol desaturase/sphingolipid hydroxylase (fatty acid hydroxylase superfamily)
LREARIARHRLYPVSLVYSAYSLTILALALRSSHRWIGVGSFVAGLLAWTYFEYLIHRYILHGSFPDGDGIRHTLHTLFDHLHHEHHARPWDGRHVNGTLRDTAMFTVPVAAVSLLAPVYTAPVFVAGILQGYIAEEWIHHAVHFCQFNNRYFRYIKRHHLYHHSPHGAEAGYGLTNGVWDVVLNTRYPEDVRQTLHRRPSIRRRGARPREPQAS